MKSKIFTLSAVALAALSASAAQPRFVELGESELPKGFGKDNFRGNITFVDFNNDGRLDLVFKTRDMSAGWNPNQGICFSTPDGLAPANKAVFNDVAGANIKWNMQVLPMDFNNDGLVDVMFFGQYGWNPAFVLENKGLNAEGIPQFAFAQDPDAVIETWTDDNGNPCSNYDPFLNPDMTPQPSLHLEDDVIENRGANSYALVGDFNNDGFQDIVTIYPTLDRNGESENQFKNGNMALYLGTGKGAFVRKDGSGIPEARSGAVCAGDINNDGILDLAVCGWNDTVGGDATYVMLGNGDGTFKTVENEISGVESGALSFLDYNGDGNLDLFLTGEDGGKGWVKRAELFFGDGTGKFAPANLGLYGSAKGGLDWCDINNDGFIDIIYNGDIANANNEGVSCSVVVLNEDGKKAVPSYDMLSGNRSGANVAIADFYGDDAMSLADFAGIGYPTGSNMCVTIAHNTAKTTGPTGIKKSYKNAVAPTELNMTSAGNTTTFSWNAGSDDITAEAALRYNVYVKFTDGSIFTLTPANIETGFVTTNRVDNTLFTRSYTINRPESEIAEWGVQTINQARLGSPFAKKETTGIASVAANAEVLATEYYDLMGRKVSDCPAAGVYIVKDIMSDGSCKVSKVSK